ncbi:MAG: dipeptidase [Alphaproteobacteria bacterium]|nr:dipeptidase [Alphaproteobacteria bacterium]
MVSPAALALHRDALIVDALNFFSDGDPGVLADANVAAVNITVSHFEADFEATCDQVAGWLARLRRPDCPWRLVRAAADIPAARAAGKTALIMGWQNLRPIADKLDRLALFHDLGVSVMQLTYNQRNFIGDGCLEPDNGSLTALGIRAVALMNELGIAIDLSHVGERTSLKAAEVSTRPVLVTHANAKSVTSAPRNKSDDVIRAIAATGGVIGVSIYGPMCWDGDPARAPSLDDFLRQLDHVVNLVGLGHVGLGTDLPAVRDPRAVADIIAMTLARFPAAIAAYAKAFGNDIRTRYLTDCSSHADLVLVTDALLVRGWRPADVAALLGGNWLRVLDRIWTTR